MKPPPCPILHGMLTLITAFSAMTSCSSDTSYLSKPITRSELSVIDPRGYLSNLTPPDRDAAAMELARGEMQSRKIEQNKLRR